MKGKDTPSVVSLPKREQGPSLGEDQGIHPGLPSEQQGHKHLCHSSALFPGTLYPGGIVALLLSTCSMLLLMMNECTMHCLQKLLKRGQIPSWNCNYGMYKVCSPFINKNVFKGTRTAGVQTYCATFPTLEYVHSKNK